MDIFTLFTYLLGAAVVALLIVCVGIYITSETYPKIQVYDSEKFFKNVLEGKEVEFSSITDQPTKSLSVIIPAYNEESRLPIMLEECMEYLEKRTDDDASCDYEVIIVDDGSRDRTTEVGLSYSKKYGSDKVRVLTLAKNRGKGGAVKMGMLRARGRLLLFADADGATTFSELNKVEASIRNLCKAEERDISDALAVSCGSRAHLEEESVATRSVFRTVLMYGFHFLVWLLAVRGVKDTQCGFKLLTRRAARVLFNSLHVERWAFDVEMLYIAQSLGIPIDEVAVEWNEIEGTKMTPVLSWIEMGLDLLIIWLRYTLRAWRIKGDITSS